MSQKLETYLESHAGEAQSLLERLCSQPSIAAQDVGSMGNVHSIV